MGRRVTPKTVASARRTSADETALSPALSRVEHFVEALRFRFEEARASVEATAGTSRSAARATRKLEETWADYEAAQRLRDVIAASLASAQAKVAIIEADAHATIAAAFRQFHKDRKWRRRRASTAGVRTRSKRPAARPKSPAELAAMVAPAQKAIVYVIADRNRLVARLVDARAEMADLRARVATGAPETPVDAEMIAQRIAACEEHRAYIEQQLFASARATQQLLVGLREMIQGLPEPVRSALAHLEAHEPLVRDDN